MGTSASPLKGSLSGLTQISPAFLASKNFQLAKGMITALNSSPLDLCIVITRIALRLSGTDNEVPAPFISQ